MRIKFKRLYEDSVLPCFAHEDSSNGGLVLCARVNGAGTHLLLPGQSISIGIGVAWEPSASYDESVDETTMRRVPMSGWKPALFITGRSGLTRDGILASEGLVDAGYRGEIRAHLRNESPRPFIIKTGDRIAQAVPVLLPEVEIEEVAELAPSIRGGRGFGSSGL